MWNHFRALGSALRPNSIFLVLLLLTIVLSKRPQWMWPVRVTLILLIDFQLLCTKCLLVDISVRCSCSLDLQCLLQGINVLIVLRDDRRLGEHLSLVDLDIQWLVIVFKALDYSRTLFLFLLIRFIFGGRLISFASTKEAPHVILKILILEICDAFSLFTLLETRVRHELPCQIARGRHRLIGHPNRSKAAKTLGVHIGTTRHTPKLVVTESMSGQDPVKLGFHLSLLVQCVIFIIILFIFLSFLILRAIVTFFLLRRLIIMVSLVVRDLLPIVVILLILFFFT